MIIFCSSLKIFDSWYMLDRNNQIMPINLSYKKNKLTESNLSMRTEDKRDLQFLITKYAELQYLSAYMKRTQ